MKHILSLLPSLHLAFASIPNLGLIPRKMGDISLDILVTQGAVLNYTLSSRNRGSDAGLSYGHWSFATESITKPRYLAQPRITATKRPRNSDKVCQDLPRDHHLMNFDVLNGVPFQGVQGCICLILNSAFL